MVNYRLNINFLCKDRRKKGGITVRKKHDIKKSDSTNSAKDLAKDPTPEENPKYGSKSHKNS